MITMESIQSDFISVLNSLLVIVDFKNELLSQIRSGDSNSIKDAVVASVKAASILNVPVLLTSCGDSGENDYLYEIKEILPRHEIIIRNPDCINAFEDERVGMSVRRYAREKVVITGLLTSSGFTETALSAIAAGYDVYGLIDACGDTTSERHNNGLHRMLSAGLTPITWMSLASEWMNAWADGEDNYEMTGKYNAMLSCLTKQKV
jgi:nicotinamidase-related amidase